MNIDPSSRRVDLINKLVFEGGLSPNETDELNILQNAFHAELDRELEKEIDTALLDEVSSFISSPDLASFKEKLMEQLKGVVIHKPSTRFKIFHAMLPNHN